MSIHLVLFTAVRFHFIHNRNLHEASNSLFTMYPFTSLVTTVEMPVTSAKQWEEHLKLRSLVEKIRAKQTGRAVLLV